MNKITFFLICILYVTCVNQENGASQQSKIKSLIKNNELNKNSLSDSSIINENVKNNFFDKYKLEKLDEKEVLNDYKKEIQTSLKLGRIPNFLYNQCLDYDYIQYCYLGSHDNKSLRHDIIRSLNKEEVSKILSIGNVEKLKLKCEIDSNDGLPFFRRSNYELLNKRLNETVNYTNDSF